MLDFRIETFLCVCKYMNYTKAAHALNITQPAVSQHIKYLENYYQTKLFEYSGKILMLTEAGNELKSAMLSIKHDEIYLKDNIINKGSKKPTLKFGATLSIGQFVMPDKLSDFLKKNQQVRVHMTVDNTQELLALLDEGVIDFALVEGFFPKIEYAYEFVSKEKFIAVGGMEYPIENVEKFTELFTERLLVREKGSGSREILSRYMQEYGYDIESFEDRVTVNNIYVLKKLAELNNGITFLYRAAVEEDIKRGTLKEINIRDFEVYHEFNFVWRKGSIFEEYYHEIYQKMLCK